jgi:hypothetical protein
MKLKFFHALLEPDRHTDLRATHCPSVRALPHAVAAANDPSSASGKLICRWRRNPLTRRLEARWTTHD